MLKRYYVRSSEINTETVAVSTTVDSDEIDNVHVPGDNIKLSNSQILANLDEKLQHLTTAQKSEVSDLLVRNKQLFSDVPTKTNVTLHDVDVGSASPIKQHPYRCGPIKQSLMEKEIQYMKENNIIEESNSSWSSPCILVPKPDGSVRFCTDFRKVNSVTKPDTYPLPRIDDYIDKIGSAKLVSTYDLLKGYWQVPLTTRAKEISAFVTPHGLYQYKVLPFGMMNAPATFQRLMNQVIAGLENTEVYIDDIVIYSDTWKQHMEHTKALFDRLSQAKLTVNLSKSQIGKAKITFLGHEIGQGEVKPVNAKVEAIAHFPQPQTKKELMRFLGMAGYYRKFCRNFSDVVSPLTNLLAKNTKFVWNEECRLAFEKIQNMLMSAPVLAAPDFDKPFALATDASDVGVGSVLMQEDDCGIMHPVCYFSKKLNHHQMKYSTVEKETLALILSLEHFAVYLESPSKPVVVFTDHNPLTFLSRMKNKNQRLLRWSLALQEFPLEIRHIKGKDNVIADALSRCY